MGISVYREKEHSDMQYKGKNIYEENPSAADCYRQKYVDSIGRYLSELEAEAYGNREKFMLARKFPKTIEFYRENYIKMLGTPLTDYKKSVPDVKRESVTSDDVCKIYRLSIETMEQFYFYGMLMIPHGIERAPLVIAQHGGYGTPELCSDMHGKNNYNHMVQRLLERGVIVFAPQLLLWNTGEALETAPSYSVSYNREETDNKLKHYGSSITALEIYNIKRSIDYLETLDCVKADKIGMMGLSYGGFFTLYTMAADTRIVSGYSCGCFNDRTKFDTVDWTWKNSGNTYHDAEVAGLCAPRRLYLEVGKSDEVFDYQYAVKEAARVTKYFNAFHAQEKVRFHVWDGGHKVNSDNEGLHFFLEDFF